MHLEALKQQKDSMRYSQLSLRWTPLGPVLSVRLREISILQRVK